MTTAELLERCISWEYEARDLYVRFAQAFAADVSTSEMWKQMAIDESAHGALLARSLETMSYARRSEVVGAELQAMVNGVDRQLESIRATPVRTLSDAYDLAHMLESSEINTVFSLALIASPDDEVRKTLLRTQLEDHTDRLNEFGRTFGRSVRESIIAGA